MEFTTLSDFRDRTYYNNNSKGYLAGFEQTNARPNIEQPISAPDDTRIRIGELGSSVPEGQQFGSFIQTAQNAIKLGTGKVELSSNMGGGHEAVGVEAYGDEARQTLREIFKVNQTEVTSIHTPVQIGNLSGYNQQERGFSDEHKKMGLDEVKKAIDFAADVNGGAVVVHTGEFQRDMSDQPWAKDENGEFKFLGYDEEPGRNVMYLVDDRTGKLITEVRKSMVIHEPDFEMKADPNQNGRLRWIKENGQFIDERDPDELMLRIPKHDEKNTKFKTVRRTWDHFVNRAEEWNVYNPKPNGESWTPEEMYFRSQMDTRILQSRGSSLYHGKYYKDEKKNYEEMKKAYDFAKSIEDNTPVEEQWKLLESLPAISRGHYAQKFAGNNTKKPSEIIKEEIDQAELGLRYTHESSSAADAQADETIETMKHVVSVGQYAKKQSMRSFAEAGIYAMERSKHNPHSKKDVFVAPENIFPEMGYGSHPEELIELVKGARQEMVDLITKKTIPDPTMKKRDQEGNLIEINNPYYDPSKSRHEAEEDAKAHIKATLDTQHLGMWWKHFQPKHGESKGDRKKRFDNWYMEQIQKLEKEDIIGHIHVVDAQGGGHQHLPVGQGTLPVRQALEFLKSKGFSGTMVSEAHGEERMHGQGRILTSTWKGLGTELSGTGYSVGAPRVQGWRDVQSSYFGVTQNPYFIFGSYSPSNEWQLWSQVPME